MECSYSNLEGYLSVTGFKDADAKHTGTNAFRPVD